MDEVITGLEESRGDDVDAIVRDGEVDFSVRQSEQPCALRDDFFRPVLVGAPDLEQGPLSGRSHQNLDHFRVSGRSLEPGVPDGSWCLFRGFPADNAPKPRQLDGRRVVVQLLRGGDGPEAGAFTLKRLRVDALDEEGHAKEIELLPARGLLSFNVVLE